MSRLLLATNNAGKVREYRELLAGLPYELVTPAVVGITMKVEETGSTFAENASLKATALANASGLLTLADDSGLEVDALNGEPGTRSARYAGDNATDKHRVAYLLAKLKDVPPAKRTARFRCVIAIAQPGKDTVFCEGECAGVIALEPRGRNGFGYDPVFFVPEYGLTMAELSSDVKNRISHRGRAAAKAREVLKAGG